MRLSNSGVHVASHGNIDIVKYTAWRSGAFLENPAADTEVTNSGPTFQSGIEIHVLRGYYRRDTIGYICSDTHKEVYEKIHNALKGNTTSDIIEYAMAYVLPQMSLPTFKDILRRTDRDAYDEGVHDTLRVQSRMAEAKSATDLRDVLDALTYTVERRGNF